MSQRSFHERMTKAEIMTKPVQKARFEGLLWGIIFKVNKSGVTVLHKAWTDTSRTKTYTQTPGRIRY